MNLLPAFQELLVSPAKLQHCMRAASMQELFGLLRQWWGDGISDRGLMAERHRQLLARLLELEAQLLVRAWDPQDPSAIAEVPALHLALRLVNHRLVAANRALAGQLFAKLF